MILGDRRKKESPKFVRKTFSIVSGDRFPISTSKLILLWAHKYSNECSYLSAIPRGKKVKKLHIFHIFILIKVII